MQTTAAAGRTLHRGPQPLLPPRRPEGAAAALHRPLRAAGGRPQADPDQDRRRRDRPAGARAAFKDYTFLKESEKRSGLHVLLWESRAAAHFALYPNLNAQRPGLARAVPRRALPAGAVARPSTATRSTSSSTSASAAPATTRCCRKALCGPTNIGTAVAALRPGGGQPAAGRDRPDRRAPDGIAPAAGRPRRWSSWSRPPARTASRATCSSWSRRPWPRSASRSQQAVAARGAAQPDLFRRRR